MARKKKGSWHGEKMFIAWVNTRVMAWEKKGSWHGEKRSWHGNPRHGMAAHTAVYNVCTACTAVRASRKRALANTRTWQAARALHLRNTSDAMLATTAFCAGWLMMNVHDTPISGIIT